MSGIWCVERAALCWVLLLLAGCGAAATPEPTTLTVVGSTSMLPVLQQLASEYSRQHPNVVFDLRGGGSTLAEEAVRAGQPLLAASTRFPPDVEAGEVVPAGEERLVRTPIGLDGLAVIVHASNSVKALSLVQLRDLYSGRVLNWQALGSDAGDVVLVSREDGSGARLLFEKRVMGEERVSLTAVVMPSSEAVPTYVSRNPAAIAYLSRAYVREQLEDPSGQPSELAPLAVKVLSLEGQLPTVESLAKQQYPLIQPLYLITAGPPAARERLFIDFVLSPAGQAIVAQYHAPIR